MAFPTTGIIDNFNRSDEGPPLSSNWTAVSNGHKVVSNTCEATISGDCRSLWNASTFGPDCEAYITIVEETAWCQSVYLRMTTLVNGTMDGYNCYADTGNDYIEIFRVENGGFTQLGASVAHTWADGDKIGGECIGDTIKGYIDSGSGWGEEISRTDSSYPDAGYIGLRTQPVPAAYMTLDDFGGGTIVSGDTELVVAEALHAHSVDNIDLTQAHILAIAESLHDHLADNIDLTQAHVLAIAEALHGHVSDNIDLFQAHTLAIADSLHGHLADNITLDVGAVVLIVADALHGHSAESPVLTQAHVLAIAEALHNHQADAVDLVQAYTLIVAACDHAHSADNITLETAILLIVADALHNHSVDNITLSQVHQLLVDAGLHSHLAETVALFQAHTLAMNDAAHAHLVDNIVLDLIGEIAKMQSAIGVKEDPLLIGQKDLRLIGQKDPKFIGQKRPLHITFDEKEN